MYRTWPRVGWDSFIHQRPSVCKQVYTLPAMEVVLAYDNVLEGPQILLPAHDLSGTWQPLYACS